MITSSGNYHLSTDISLWFSCFASYSHLAPWLCLSLCFCALSSTSLATAIEIFPVFRASISQNLEDWTEKVRFILAAPPQQVLPGHHLQPRGRGQLAVRVNLQVDSNDVHCFLHSVETHTVMPHSYFTRFEFLYKQIELTATCRSPPDEQAIHLAACSNTSWKPSAHSACKTDKSKLVPKADQMKPCCNKGVKASRFRHVAVDQRKSSDMYGMVRFILETIPGNTKTIILHCDCQQNDEEEWNTHLSRTYSYFSGQRILARFSGSNMAGS